MIVFYSNTLWFLFNFKADLIRSSLVHSDVTLLYMFEGPPSKGFDLSGYDNKLVISKLDFKFVFYLLFRKIRARFVLSYTVVPLLTTWLFVDSNTSIATIEGLGRVFSSRRVFYRIMKRYIEMLYRWQFSVFYDKVIVLNYYDYTYLLSRKIVSLGSLEYQPGTGIDLTMFPYDYQRESILKGLLAESYKCEVRPVKISMISRLQPDKGFLVFIAARLALKNEFPNLFNKTIFQLIAPEKDFKKLDDNSKKRLEELGILCMQYKSDPNEIYKQTDILVHPSQYAEGLSRIVLEAGAVGIPLIVSMNRGIVDIVPSREYGYIIQGESNPSQIAFYIYQILDNPKDAFTRAQRLRERINSFFANEKSNMFILRLLGIE